jgi:hypothetical protein
VQAPHCALKADLPTTKKRRNLVRGEEARHVHVPTTKKRRNLVRGAEARHVHVPIQQRKEETWSGGPKRVMFKMLSVMSRIGQNRIYTTYMTVYLVISLPNLPYIHHIYRTALGCFASN